MSYNLFKKNKNKSDSSEDRKVDLIDTIDITSVSKARKWVANLPVTDMGETTRHLFTGVTKLNNNGSITPQIRVDVTEILLPFMKMALENLDRHFLSRTFPLPARSQKVFDLKKALMMELAGSYQLAALDMLTKSEVSKKSLLISIGRAIHYMGLVVTNDYSIYIKNKKNIWHDIHRLYLLACEQNVHNKKIPNDKENLNIEDLYKLVNLVALVLPNTLRQSEVTRVREFFLKMLDKVSLIPSGKIKSKYAHIALLNSDEPASLMPVTELDNASANRIFDLTTVLHQLDDFVGLSEADELGKNDKWPMLSNSLGKRLANVLTTIQHRKYKRFDREEKASVVIRMVDVIQMIKGNQPSSFMEDLNEEDDAQENIYDALLAEDTTESPWIEGDDEQETHRDITIYSWHIENSSSGGYGLKQTANEDTTARVGELIAIKDPKDTKEMWQIAVTRWMDSFKGEGLRIGLEILSLHSMMVKVTEVKTRKITQKLPLQGILLPAIEGVRDESHLIFPGYIFHADDELKVTIGSREEHIRITNIDDTVGNFSYCNFEILRAGESGEGSLESFDDVWEFI